MERSKCTWQRERDRNTKFFHAMASARKRNNMIVKIKDEEERWHKKKDEITDVFELLHDTLFNVTSFGYGANPGNNGGQIW